MKKYATAGFTLIEMLIAMTIMAIIGIALYEGTTSTFVLRDSIERDSDFYNSIRVAIDVIGRDIAHVYSPKSIALPGEAGKAEADSADKGQENSYQQTAQLGEPTEFWGAPINNFGVRPSRLQSYDGKLTFVINSHIRLFQNSQESDFAKITYELSSTKLGAKSSDGRKLIKRENPAAFTEDSDPEAGATYTLLTNVKSLQFKFLDGEKDSWESKWDTVGIDHKDKFPDVIEVLLEIYYPGSENTFSVSERFRPEQIHDI